MADVDVKGASSTWVGRLLRRSIGASAIGAACGALSHRQPQSMIGAVLLVIALNLYLWDL